MATSPHQIADGLLSAEVFIDGSPLNDQFLLSRISINEQLFQIPEAEVELRLPMSPTGDLFAGTEAEEFDPGRDVEIRLGYDNELQSVFKGESVNARFKLTTQEGMVVVLQCRDKARRLQGEPGHDVYEDLSDTDLLTTLILEQGLSVEADGPPTIHPQLINFGLSNWGFILSRAAANELLVYSESGKVFIKQPIEGGNPVLTVRASLDVIDFQADTGGEGKVSFMGNALPRLNTLLELEEFGERFSGNVLIYGIEHQIEKGQWKTSVLFGKPGEMPETLTLGEGNTAGHIQAIQGYLAEMGLTWGTGDQEQASKNQIVLSEKEGATLIQDSHGNKLAMDEHGIRLSSVKDLTVSAPGKIEIAGTGAVSVVATGGNVSLEGLNVNARAKVAFSAEGSASAELKAAGQTSVKGAMVMIN